MTDPRELGRAVPVDPDASEVVAIAGDSYTIVPQKLGRLRSRLGVLFAALSGAGELDTASILREKPYELLAIFIPDLAPEWKLWGAVTAEAFAAGDFDDDRGATFPELERAFRTALRVNHFDLLGVVGKFFGPSTKVLIEKAINVELARYLERTLTSSSSPPGPASGSPPSTTIPRTSELHAA